MLKRKRPSLLLELILVTALISLAALFVVRNPTAFFTNQLHNLEKIECERIAENSFAEIKERLYNNREKEGIKWEEIAKNRSSSLIASLPPVELTIPCISSRKEKTPYTKKLPRSYRIFVEKEKEGEQKSINRLIQIDLFLGPIGSDKKPLIYSYQLFLSKKAKD